MKKIEELFQTADWKVEKHVPVIDAPGKAKKGEPVKVTVSIGKQVAHHNTTEHHIVWIEVFFLPQDEKFPYHLGRFEFLAHGSSVQGPNTSSIYTHPEITGTFMTEKPGMIYAYSYCNIHGLWSNSQELKVG
jgi:superoxide reductase